jgi:hypothetical protein
MAEQSFRGISRNIHLLIAAAVSMSACSVSQPNNPDAEIGWADAGPEELDGGEPLDGEGQQSTREKQMHQAIPALRTMPDWCNRSPTSVAQSITAATWLKV